MARLPEHFTVVNGRRTLLAFEVRPLSCWGLLERQARVSESPEHRRLGRGLSTFLAAAEAPLTVPEGSSVPLQQVVSVSQISANPDQPRKNFDSESLAQLAESIRQKGVIQPLVVRQLHQTGGYQIVAGERRWRAAQLAGLSVVPVVVRDFDDDEVLQVALIENIQRAELGPLEEAEAYRLLIHRFGHTQEQLADAMSKSRSHIANLLRLLSLPEPVQEMLRDKRLSMGQARALITSKLPIELAQQVVEQGLSVREVELLVKREDLRPVVKPNVGGQVQSISPELLRRVSIAMGMPVGISLSRDGRRGKLVASFDNTAEVERLCELLERAGSLEP